MVDIYECHFEYKGINSRKYDLIIANVNTERFMPICGVKDGAFVFNKASKSRYLVGDSYENTPLSFDIEILTCNGRALDIKSVREIERWLFTNSVFNPLYIDIEDDPFGETYEFVFGCQRRLYFNCRLLAPEKIESDGGIIGFKCTLETDSMMMWQEPASVYVNFGDSEIVSSEGGVEYVIIKGDADGDGMISANDAQVALVLSVEGISGKSISDWFYDDGTVKDQEALQKIPLPQPITRTELIRCLMACDLSYSQEDFDNEIVPDLRDIGVDDANNILRMYTTLVSLKPVVLDVVDIGGQPIQNADDVREFTIPVDSDIDGYTYPVITLTVGSVGGAIEIENRSDYRDNVFESSNRITKIVNTTPNSTIIIDSTVSMLKGINYNNMTKKHFPRFVEGDNVIRVKGDVLAMTVEWQNRRFM